MSGNLIDGHFDSVLICSKKEKLLKPDSGLLYVHFMLDEEQKIINSLPEGMSYPGIWVSSLYDQIDEAYQEGELFAITMWSKVDERDNEYSDISSTQVMMSHWTRGNYTKRIRPNRLFQVIEGELPEISSGAFKSSHDDTFQHSFFIFDKKHYVGPFTAAEVNEESTRVEPANIIKLGLQQEHVIKFSESEARDSNISSNSLSTDNKYILLPDGLKQIANDFKHEEIDYINDIKLASYFSKVKSKSSRSKLISKAELQKIKQSLESSITQNDIKKTDRYKRIIGSLKKLEGLSSLSESVLKETLSDSYGVNILKELAKKNTDIKSLLPDATGSIEKEKISLGELKSERKDLEEKLLKLKEEIFENEGKVKELKSKVAIEEIESDKKIKDIKSTTKEEIEKQHNARTKELDEEIKKLEQKKEELGRSIDNAINQLDDLDSYQDLKTHIKIRHKDYADINRQVEHQSKLLENPENLQTAIVENELITKILRGQPVNISFNQNELRLPEKIEKEISKDDIVDHLWARLNSSLNSTGRVFSRNETINFMICLQQSLLTIFAGKPGTGKTSTTLKIADALGIYNDNKEKTFFLNIPVGRGWTAARDFIGFFNGMKNCYQPAKTGMYQFLRTGEMEGADEFNRLILLDEANLSPLEYYWSDFIALCDPESRNRPIDTGVDAQDNKRYLNVGKSIRFVATINYDHTTERLSPRLCDRSPIISMDIPELKDENFSTLNDEFSKNFGYDVLNDAFGLTEIDELDTDSAVVENIIDLLTKREDGYGMPVDISKRKKNAIQQYLAKALDFMSKSEANDFAVSQYLIPLISGNGEQFKHRLVQINEYIKRNQLTRSTCLLQGIIDRGEQYIGSYDFF